MGRKKKAETSLSIKVWEFLSHLRNASAIVKDNESKDLWISILAREDRIDAGIVYNKSQVSLHVLLKDILEDHSSQDLVMAVWHMKGHKTKFDDYISERLNLSSEQVRSFEARDIDATSKRTIKVVSFNFAEKPKRTPLLDARDSVSSSDTYRGSPRDAVSFINDAIARFSSFEEVTALVTPPADGGDFSFASERQDQPGEANDEESAAVVVDVEDYDVVGAITGGAGQARAFSPSAGVSLGDDISMSSSASASTVSSSSANEPDDSRRVSDNDSMVEGGGEGLQLLDWTQGRAIGADDRNIHSSSPLPSVSSDSSYDVSSSFCAF
mmetsp:Transcript_9035/g.18463  ORF Transcript_9035/g.18463 Transcript_9035/m.18463 type:complete len:326 (+) Transcript_9035:312-1289(+)